MSLHTDDLFRKLVQSHRGGYCFEQNFLFAAALRACGFTIYMCARYLPVLLVCMHPRRSLACTCLVQEFPSIAAVAHGNVLQQQLQYLINTWL